MEKRDNRRLDKRLFVKFGEQRPEHIGFTGDVSNTGLFIKSNTIFRPGTLLHVELSLPDETVIRLNARVMWAKKVPPNLMRFVKKSGMGVQLTGRNSSYEAFFKGING
jgi:Tfp pilus assembly protein PilZ